MAAADTLSDGFVVLPAGLGGNEVDALLAALSDGGAEVSGGRGGVRSLLRDVPAVREIARRSTVRDAATAVLGEACRPVRALLFDKTADANWKVLWHQDRTIAVKERRNIEGFGPWSVKDGIEHVQPPDTILKAMVAVRLHLDDCGADNGPLRVLPGSHRAGKLTPENIAAWRARVPETVCLIPRGGLLVMRPLLLHASSAATRPGHRRVLHIEYAVGALPAGLEWFEEASWDASS